MSLVSGLVDGGGGERRALTVCEDDARSLQLSPVTAAGAASARFRVHKSGGERGVRLFESLRFPDSYLRISDGVADCLVRPGPAPSPAVLYSTVRIHSDSHDVTLDSSRTLAGSSCIRRTGETWRRERTVRRAPATRVGQLHRVGGARMPPSVPRRLEGQQQ